MNEEQFTVILVTIIAALLSFFVYRANVFLNKFDKVVEVITRIPLEIKAIYTELSQTRKDVKTQLNLFTERLEKLEKTFEEARNQYFKNK